MSLCTTSLGHTFRPQVDHFPLIFEFSLLFEKWIFSIGPFVTLLLEATFRYAVLQQAQRQVLGISTRVLKLIVILCSGAVHWNFLLQQCLDGDKRKLNIIIVAFMCQRITPRTFLIVSPLISLSKMFVRQVYFRYRLNKDRIAGWLGL